MINPIKLNLQFYLIQFALPECAKKVKNQYIVVNNHKLLL